MSEEYVVVNVYRSEEKVEEIPQTAEVSSEKKEDLRSKLLGMIDEALSFLDRIQPVPGVISEDELLQKRMQGRRLRGQISSASDQDLSKLQPQVETYYNDIKALYETYTKQAQASLDEQKRYGRKLIGDIKNFLSKTSSLFNTDPVNKDVNDLSNKLDQANDISTVQSIVHSLVMLYNFSKDLSSFVDLYNSLSDDVKGSQDVKSLIDEVNKRISQKSYNISDLLSRLNDIVKRSQEISERRKKIDELSKRLDDIWNRYQDLFMDPAERKPWSERYSRIKQMLDQALKDSSVDLSKIEEEINKFESDLKSLRESKLKAREENIRQLMSRLDESWNKVKDHLKDPELRRMLSRYNELKAKLEQALKDPSVNISDLVTAVTSFINELENIYRSVISVKRSDYEREYQRFMSLYNSLKAYMFPIQLPPSPDQVRDFDQALRDLDNYYNMLLDSIKRFAQYSYTQNYREIARLVENYPYRDYILSLLNEYYQKILSMDRNNIDPSVISSFYTISNNILKYRETFFNTLAFMNDSLRSQIESNIADVLKQLGFKDSDAKSFAQSYTYSLSDVSRIYLDPQKSGLLNYIALVYAAYNSGVISKDTFNSILPSNILNIVLKIRRGEELSREEFNELVMWYASNKSNIDRIMSTLNQEVSRNSLMMSHYNTSISSLINGQAPQISPVATGRGVLDDVLRHLSLTSAYQSITGWINSLNIDPNIKWALNNVVVPALMGVGVGVLFLVPGGQIVASAIVASGIGYLASQMADPVLRDQFIQTVSKDPGLLRDILTQIGLAVVSGVIAGRALANVSSVVKMRILEAVQSRVPTDSTLYKISSALLKVNAVDGVAIPTEKDIFYIFRPRPDGSADLIIYNYEKGSFVELGRSSLEVSKFFGDLVKTADGKIVLSRIAEMIDRRGITSISFTKVGGSDAVVGSGDLQGFIILQRGDQKIPIILDFTGKTSGTDLAEALNFLRGITRSEQEFRSLVQSLTNTNYFKEVSLKPVGIEGNAYVLSKSDRLMIVTPLKTVEADPRDLALALATRETMTKYGIPDGVVMEILRSSLDAPYIRTIDQALADWISRNMIGAGQVSYSRMSLGGDTVHLIVSNIDFDKYSLLSMLLSYTDVKPGSFGVIPGRYETSSIQMFRIQPKADVNIRIMLERYGIKVEDFSDPVNLRTKISGAIEKAREAGDTTSLQLLTQIKEIVDTQLVNGLKPMSVVISGDGRSLTLITSADTSTAVASANIQKTQNMIKEVSQIKVLDQATLNNLINKYGGLVSQYLSRFKFLSSSREIIQDQRMYVPERLYEEVVKPETSYDKKIVNIQLRPLLISRQLVQDQSKVIPERRYEEIMKPTQDYIRETVDIYLRPVIISRQIIQDQRKVVPEKLYEEIVKPVQDYTRRMVEVYLKPVMFPRIIVQDQSKVIPERRYEEISQPVRDYVRRSVEIQLRPVVVPVEEYIDTTVVSPVEIYEEIVRPVRDHVKKTVDIQLMSLVIPKTETIDQTKTIARELYEEVMIPVRDYVRRVTNVNLKPIVVSRTETLDETTAVTSSEYIGTTQPEKQETSGAITVLPTYIPIYGVQVKTTYVPPPEEGPPISVSSGVISAPPTMIPAGAPWREITTPKVEERRPQREKVVL